MKFGKSIKIGFFALFLNFSVIFSATSQVTIGTLEQPLKGTLLDLKESKTSDGNANSQKGLMLPRVTLTDVYSLSPILSGEDLSNAKLKPDYTGLIVYNVNTNAPFEKGLYSWNGTQWNLLSPIEVANGLNLSNSTIKLGGDLSQTTTINLDDNDLIFDSSRGGKVGIGTSQPTATLDINGTGRISNTPTSQDRADKYLVVNNAGNIYSRSYPVTRIGEELQVDKTTNWANSKVSEVMDFYFVDKNHKITLPKMPNADFSGKLIRFYIYGGDDVKVSFIGVRNPVNWSQSIPGYIYNAVGEYVTLTVSDYVLGNSDSVNHSVRFRFIDIISDGKHWWVNHK